jgi:hypothetical protein
MSRVLVIEVPDKYEVTSRTVLNIIREKYPDVHLLRSCGFQWWKDICAKNDDISIPFISSLPEEKVIQLIHSIKNTKSFEEREANA